MDEDLKKLMKLTNKMIVISDRMDAKRQPYRVHVLAGTVRDSAYAIRKKVKEADNVAYRV